MGKVSKFTILTLLLNSSLTIMVGSVIAPALTAISKNLQFGLSPALLVTLPSLGVLLFSPFVGKLIDKIGAFKLLMAGMLPYAVLGFIGIYLHNTYALALDRLLLGGACVAIQVSGTLFIAELFEGKERLKLIAWQGMAIELGGVVFLSLGGFLGELHWSYPFYIYLIAILFFAFSWYALPRSQEQPRQIAPTLTTKSTKVLYPVMFASFFSMALFFVSFISLPEYLPEKFNFSESDIGYFMSLISLVAVVVSSQLANISDYISSQNLVMLGLLSFSASYLIFAVAPFPEIMFVGAILVGIGFAFTVPVLNHSVVEISSPQARGRNLGYYSMMVFAGQFAATFIQFIPNTIDINFLITSVIGVAVSIILFIVFRNKKNTNKRAIYNKR